MSGQTHPVVLTLGFIASFFAIGLPYWLIPYSQVGLPNDIWGWGLVVVAIIAFLCRAFAATSFWRTTLVVGAAVPAAVFARVVVEVLQDPTSHNLWPLELILSAVPGLLAAGAGALVGSFVVRIRNKGEMQ